MNNIKSIFYDEVFKNLREHIDKRVLDALLHYSSELLFKLNSNKDLLLNEEDFKFFECLIHETYRDWKKNFERTFDL